MATVTPVKPVKGKNFESKRDRKKRRKGIVRAALANRVADVKITAHDRAQFYRTLREKKLRRREIAQHMQLLADMVADLHNTVRRQANRYNCDPFIADEALSQANAVKPKAQAIADDYARLSRQKIYFGEAERGAA